jgi:hypothetical protein
VREKNLEHTLHCVQSNVRHPHVRMLWACFPLTTAPPQRIPDECDSAPTADQVAAVLSECRLIIARVDHLLHELSRNHATQTEVAPSDHQPVFLERLRDTILDRHLRSLDVACGSGLRLFRRRILRCFSHFARPFPALLAEREDASILEPASALLLMGKVPLINFHRGNLQADGLRSEHVSTLQQVSQALFVQHGWEAHACGDTI